MGLELHLKDILKANQEVGSDSSVFDNVQLLHEWIKLRYKHVMDVVDSCKIAHTTLSDMLTYDKIESSMLQFERAEIPLQSFLFIECRSYAIQVCNVMESLCYC